MRDFNQSDRAATRIKTVLYVLAIYAAHVCVVHFIFMYKIHSLLNKDIVKKDIKCNARRMAALTHIDMIATSTYTSV